jgi:hypothetical protein
MGVLFKELFTTDIGLLSLGVILFVIGMGIWFSRWFQKKIDEDTRTQSDGPGPTSSR